jgi:hypothetical protein
MPHISEHHSEKEWKCNYCYQGRIGFKISWYSICIYYKLKHFRKIIRLNICWLCNFMTFIQINYNRLMNLHFLHDNVFLINWSPKVAHQQLVLAFHHVHCLEKSFLFGHKHFVYVQNRNIFIRIRINFIEWNELFN